GDLAILLQGGLREMFTTIASTLMSEPIALFAFILAFAVVLLGGSAFMFIIKGGTVAVLLASNAAAGPIEREPLTLGTVQPAAVFTLQRFTDGCARVYRRYLLLGLVLMIVYGLSVAAYLTFVVYGYRVAEGRALLLGWTVIAAMAAAVLVAWITVVNFLYLLTQIAIAADDSGVTDAVRAVARFIRAEFRDLALVFLVIVALVVAATFASALAWSGVGLIAFVPLVGLAVFPLQLAALVVRGLVFQYLGLSALGAYATLYAGHAARRNAAVAMPTAASAASARASRVAAWAHPAGEPARRCAPSAPPCRRGKVFA